MNKLAPDVNIGTVHIGKKTYPLIRAKDGRVYYEVENKLGNIERNYMFPELLDPRRSEVVDSIHRV